MRNHGFESCSVGQGEKPIFAVQTMHNSFGSENHKAQTKTVGEAAWVARRPEKSLDWVRAFGHESHKVQGIRWDTVVVLAVRNHWC